MKKQNAVLNWIAAVILGVACALAPCSAHAQSRFCASAWIQEPFVLPDGSEHAPGNLKICTGAPMSPVSQLQRTYVDGTPMGAFLSRSDDAELHVTDSVPALFVFQRDADGRLCLERYAVWDGRKAQTYDMNTGKPGAMTVARRGPRPIPPVPEQRTIVVAATRN